MNNEYALQRKIISMEFLMGFMFIAILAETEGWDEPGHSSNHGFPLQARMVGSKAMMKKEFSDWLTQASVKVTIVIMPI